MLCCSFASERESPLHLPNHQTPECIQLLNITAGPSNGSSRAGPPDGAEQTRGAAGPDQAAPNPGKAVSGRSVRGSRLMSFLPSCLQPKES